MPTNNDKKISELLEKLDDSYRRFEDEVDSMNRKNREDLRFTQNVIVYGACVLVIVVSLMLVF